MCRLLVAVSSEATDYRFSLRQAPRSLAALSREHPDGWGIAVHNDERGWELSKHPACAGDDDRFAGAAAAAHGKILVAHVRKRTVGPVGPLNTHPFQRGRWVFAHNGTILDTAWLEEQTSAERRGEVEGETDSERFFAFLLTVIDRAEPGRVDAAIGAAMSSAIARPGFGAVNFVLADGAVLYAHRHGRTLHLLERGRGDRVRSSRTSIETGAVVDTPWSARRTAILIASEHMTDEPWQEIAEGSLIRVDCGAIPTWRVL
jgi:predicted glutamine amidotransferase